MHKKNYEVIISLDIACYTSLGSTGSANAPNLSFLQMVQTLTNIRSMETMRFD